MPKFFRRRRALAPLAAAAFAVCAAPLAIPTADAETVADTERVSSKSPTVVRMVGAASTPRPLTYWQKAALYQARAYAERHPYALAHPFIRPSTGRLVLPALNDSGRARATAVGARVGRAGARPVVASATRSFAALERIKHEVIGLNEAVLPGAGTLVTSAVDERRNRVVVESSAPSRALRAGLAARYGADAVVVRRVSAPPLDGGPLVRGRWSDVPPWSGGARIWRRVGSTNVRYGCTSGIPYFKARANHYMLTAGHCMPNGGVVRRPSGRRIGTVAKNTRENWSPRLGTVPLRGDDRNLGDLALIKTTNTGKSSRFVYGGGPRSSLRRAIDRADYTFDGDNYCTSGVMSGEICGWVVQDVFVDHRYRGDGTVARNVAVATKKGRCVRPGDSGGPVYYRLENGDVRVKGITSGESGHGGDDYKTGRLENPCVNVFTDVYRAYDAWGGHVRSKN